MTKAQRQKAVAVAEDALFNMKFVTLRTGVYFQSGAVTLADTGKRLQQIVIDRLFKNARKKKCETCGLGLLFLSHVKLFNRYTVGKSAEAGSEFLDTNECHVSLEAIKPLLQKSMGLENMALIETAFETSSMNGVDADLPGAIFSEAIQFGQKYEDPKKRLTAILKNLIKNDGEFLGGKKKLAIEAAKKEEQAEYNTGCGGSSLDTEYYD